MLASMNIPASVEKIGALAFYDSGLESVVFEHERSLASMGSFVSKICILAIISCNFPKWCKENNYLQTFPKAFCKTPLHSINIPKNVKIGWYAFKQTGCDDIKIFKSGVTICQCEIVPVILSNNPSKRMSSSATQAVCQSMSPKNDLSTKPSINLTKKPKGKSKTNKKPKRKTGNAVTSLPSSKPVVP